MQEAMKKPESPKEFDEELVLAKVLQCTNLEICNLVCIMYISRNVSIYFGID